MSDVTNIKLNDGRSIPQFGFGVFQVPADETAKAVRAAFDAGYRHIDTAQMYGNEEGVGRAIAEAGIDRSELFITTKLNNSQHGHDAALRELDTSLGKLGTDYVDLYLIHWPLPKLDRYVETWKAFEEAKADGRARSIGVSNFQVGHLDRLAAETSTVPSINQIELHPYFQQRVLRDYHREHGIGTEAWSPLAQGGDVLKDPAVAEIAERHGKSGAQVVLRWHLQVGNIVFPKSATPARVQENIDVYDFELSADEVTAIDALDRDERIGANPDEFDYRG